MRNIKRILYWSGLVLGAGLFVWQLWRVIQTLPANTLPILSPGMLAAAWAGMIALIFLQILNWRLILTGVGHRLGTRDLVMGMTLSFLPRYIPGSVWGYLSRVEWLHRTHQIPYIDLNFSSILDILVPVVSSLMVTGFFMGVTAALNLAQRLLLLALSLLLPVLVWLVIDRIIRVSPEGRWKRVRSFFPRRNISLGHWLGCILIFLLQWLVLGLVIVLSNAAFSPIGEIRSQFTAWNVFASTYAFSLAWLVGFLILFVPGGIGVREAVLSTLIFLNMTVSYEQAVLVSVFSRGLYSFAELFWIFVGLALQGSKGWSILQLKRREKGAKTGKISR